MNKLVKRAKLIIVLIASLIILSGFLFVVFRDPLNARGAVDLRRVLLRNSFVQKLLPSYHSFRKLPDLLFFPYYFTKSDLPVYSFYLGPSKLITLSERLPEDPLSGFLTNEDRVYVKGIFKSGDYQDEVKIRYRGTGAHHWNSYQKSYKLKFPKEHLFQGMDNLSLIIPYDRGYFVEPLNFYRAKKFGLTALDLYFARFTLNGQDMGVYLAAEGWSNKWLESRRVPSNMTVYGSDDARSAIGNNTDKTSNLAVKTPEGEIYLNHYTSEVQKGSLEALIDIIYKADDKTFKRLIGNIFDLKKFYGWNIMNILAGSGHFDDTFGNLFLIFNPVSGKFELSPWDPGISRVKGPDGQYQDNRMRLVRRILSISEFREERNKMLKEYLQDEHNLQDDLAFYDKLYQQTRNDFFKDNAKLYNNFQFLRQVGFFRDMIIKNFRDAGLVFDYGTNHYFDGSDQKTIQQTPLAFSGSFARLPETASSIGEFINRNPSFVKIGPREVELPTGIYTFPEDVIIPYGFKVTIRPGTTIFMGKGVSLLSYSPIRAEGAANNPIRIIRAYPQETWGSFAVVNAGSETSKLNYVDIEGGSGDTINGITFTGQASFFTSDVDINHSSFAGASDDDSLNVKYGKAVIENSFWTKNAYDSIDLDFLAEGSIIKNSKFYANSIGKEVEGDAIDISWSNVTLEGNDINGCSDKGISVGEHSNPLIVRNTIQNCLTGIAVKDLSVAEIIDNTIKHVETGIAAYRKKEVFGGGIANIQGIKMEDVKTDYKKDEFSQINLK